MKADPASSDADTSTIVDRFVRAKARRQHWESLWQDCYDVTLPQRRATVTSTTGATQGSERIFDGTAPDAVDQLAASLLAQLTPPWSDWFGLVPGPRLAASDRNAMEPVLEAAAKSLGAHLERANFAIEIHQCYLDLVIGGTAVLLVDEAEPGAQSALRFTAVPLHEVVLEEGPSGRLDTVFREHALPLSQLIHRFPHVGSMAVDLPGDAEEPLVSILEGVVADGPSYRYLLMIRNTGAGDTVLVDSRLDRSPFIAFRWQRAPGEIYGRSPIMKALPDIRTANKVVELILKNASIAVTGIWQADDDGVLNPGNIRLTPGSIIPKAPGSAGLTPLQSPGRFDVSQIVLDDLRARIRKAMLVDRLGQIDDRRMTATEVLERSAEIGRVMGATYGRLQSELLTPLILRCASILRRRGEFPAVSIDGRMVELDYRSPLARAQRQRDVQGTLAWLDVAAAMGPDALKVIDTAETLRWLAEAYGVPRHLMSNSAVPAIFQEIDNVR